MRLNLSRWMLYILVIGWSVIALGIFSVKSAPAMAAPVPLSKQTPIQVRVELGNEQGDLKFFPDHLSFEAGKRYQLVLENHSPTKHYFTAKDFADGIWSQKVDAGNVEVKGAIHELELRSQTHADWVFIPARAGEYALRCTVPGHAEAGMVGTINISG
ncbi:plastocyanin/azurin family copper-binding protein [Lyngbya confervoides]|uniref:Plastocyanin/azurin family copper-binding protein n=1 Tax=Lyngbya confervoides BDU141951 TaxID=1574623 RepID=A0ABD4T070_9CYAN|nr:plastocyanin/azurin family copper-binding protein [Lyngbya confervoides]MCM1981836.1 plastocyanin/azurin family copper-binding protein [Lyngbya confervoides BDU141951]